MHTYGIIKIKGSLHHTIGKVEHYFTITFSGVFLAFRIGECPSNSPFLKNNGAEGPSPIVFKEWRDTRTFSNLKSTHCTLLI